MAQGPCKKQSPGPSREHEETALIFPVMLVGEIPCDTASLFTRGWSLCHVHGRFGLESHSRGWGESGWSHFPKTLLGMSPPGLASAVPKDCSSVRIPKPFLSLSIPSHAACHRACFLFLMACLHCKNKRHNKEEKELIAPSSQLTK